MQHNKRRTDQKTSITNHSSNNNQMMDDTIDFKAALMEVLDIYFPKVIIQLTMSYMTHRIIGLHHNPIKLSVLDLLPTNQWITLKTVDVPVPSSSSQQRKPKINPLLVSIGNNKFVAASAYSTFGTVHLFRLPGLTSSSQLPALSMLESTTPIISGFDVSEADGMSPAIGFMFETLPPIVAVLVAGGFNTETKQWEWKWKTAVEIPHVESEYPVSCFMKKRGPLRGAFVIAYQTFLRMLNPNDVTIYCDIYPHREGGVNVICDACECDAHDDDGSILILADAGCTKWKLLEKQLSSSYTLLPTHPWKAVQIACNRGVMPYETPDSVLLPTGTVMELWNGEPDNWCRIRAATLRLNDGNPTDDESKPEIFRSDTAPSEYWHIWNSDCVIIKLFKRDEPPFIVHAANGVIERIPDFPTTFSKLIPIPV